MTSQPKNAPLVFDRRKTARLLLARLKDQKPFLVLWGLILAFGIALDSSIIWMTGVFTDDVLRQIELSQVFDKAVPIIGIVIILIFAQGIQKGAELLITNRIGQRLIMDLRQSLFIHLQKLSLDFYESQKTGQVMSWVTNDVSRIREFAGKQLPQLIQDPFMILTFLVLMVISSWQLTIAGILLIPIVVLIVQIGARRIRRAAANVQSTLADVSGDLQESISAIQVIKSFANEAFETLKFGRVNLGAYKAEMRRAKIEAIMVPLLMLAGAIGLGLLMCYGAWLISRGSVTPGELVRIIFLLYKTNETANKFGRSYMAFQDTLAASDRIFAFLHIEPTIKDAPDAGELNSCTGLVEFKNVSFSYSTGDEVLKHINVKAVPGSIIAFVGPSGAGKSSLGKLIPRFYDPSSGEVLVDSRDVKKLSIASLRGFIGIVPQETILFHGTVRENIAYGKLDASDSEIVEAARSANAHEFIEHLEHGYETVVGERGTRLSGGQRQRISIARAILKDPRILILDEATSNLDTESEKIVQAALERLMQGRTTFIIAHRLSTIRNATEILVLKNGEIVDRGKHDELMARPGLYKELYEVEELNRQQI